MLPTCAVTQPEMRVRSTLSPYLHRGPVVVQFETIPVHRGVGAWARASRIALACMQDRRCRYQQMRQYFSIRIRGRQRAGCGRVRLSGVSRAQAGPRANPRPWETASATLANIERYAKAHPLHQSYCALSCALQRAGSRPGGLRVLLTNDSLV